MSSTDLTRTPARLAWAVAVLTAVALGGCATTKPAEVAAAPRNFAPDAATPLAQYAVKVDRASEEIRLSVHPTGVSAAQHAALQAFAQRWRDTGGVEPIAVQAPVNSAEAADPHAAALAVGSLLQALGVPSSRVRIGAYDGGGRPGAPVYVRYEHDEAEGPDCRDGWDNLVSTRNNKPSKHFGCAATANLAAMVADPHDLLRPAVTAPADSVRRAVVLDKYRQGLITSSAKDVQATGAVQGGVN